mmetsp:Transcript_11161/g.35420  ORF Transcript_11161/g.35420 Transcript_11161/m.35420 type:complete len:269 (-) Transcript_11161:1206-2012(-)
MLRLGSSSDSAFRSVTADLLVTPICMSGLSSSNSSSSSTSTEKRTISMSLFCRMSMERLLMLSFSPVSCLGARLFSMAAVGAACPWSPCCPAAAACCCCHCCSWYCCQSASVHCGCCGSSSGGPVMCSTMPRATHSPRTSPCSRKMAKALFTTDRALFELPPTRCTSDSMHMAEATFTWSSSALKISMASSITVKALSHSMAAVCIWAMVHRTEAVSFLSPARLAVATASSASSSASAHPWAKSASTLASGISLRPCTSMSSRICARR